jgi:hypothetical protein
MYFTATTNVAYFMYKTGVMEEMIFINLMKIAWRDNKKSRQNISQTVNIIENLTCTSLKNLVLILKELERL